MDSSSTSDSSLQSEEQMLEAIFDPWDNLSNASSIYPESGEVLQKIMEWFENKGITTGAPQEISEQMVQDHRKNIILRTGAHPASCPWLSKRVKTISHLHLKMSTKTI